MASAGLGAQPKGASDRDQTDGGCGRAANADGRFVIAPPALRVRRCLSALRARRSRRRSLGRAPGRTHRHDCELEDRPGTRPGDRDSAGRKLALLFGAGGVGLARLGWDFGRAIFRRLHRGDKVGASRLTPKSVALVVKGLAAKVDLDPARYAGHTLRRGFLTSAAGQHPSIFKRADQPRHKPLDGRTSSEST